MIGPVAQWRTGYDSVHPEMIPRDAQMVFPYLPPSEFAWSKSDLAMFPHSVKVFITVHGTEPDFHGASIIDVENGAFTVAQARRFVIDRNTFRPNTATVYCNLSTLPAIEAELRGLFWHLWLADYDGTTRPPPMLPNIVAKQYISRGSYDRSVVYDPSWHKSTVQG